MVLCLAVAEIGVFLVRAFGGGVDEQIVDPVDLGPSSSGIVARRGRRSGSSACGGGIQYVDDGSSYDVLCGWL